MSKKFHFFQEAIKSCNLFTAPVGLRYKLESDYNTFSGGFLSISLIFLFLCIFSNSWIAFLNKTDVSSNTEVVREIDPSPSIFNSDDFMLAIGVGGLNITDTSQKRYFNLKVTKTEVYNSPEVKKLTTNINMEPCTSWHWQQLGGKFVQKFNWKGMNSYLCLPRNLTLDLAGKYTTQRFSYYRVGFEKCLGQAGCRSQSQIDAWLTANTSFSFNFYYSNRLLNPDQKQPVMTYLEDRDYSTFAPGLATIINMYIGEYSISTDESIFPWEEPNVESGFIVNRAEKELLNYIPSPTDSYCKLYIRKSNTKMQTERKFRKIDDMLSYMGGLFGIIIILLNFVMKYYGQCCFEFEMCQKVFNYKNRKSKSQTEKSKSQIDQQQISKQSQNLQNNNKIVNIFHYHQKLQQSSEQGNQTEPIQSVIEPKDFGFLDFLVYNIFYVPLKKICHLKWKRMQIYGDSLEEMRYKLDISQLMEKLTFYDRSINALFDESQLKLLYLQEKFNFQQVRDERNMLGLRKDMLDNIFSKIVQTINSPEGSNHAIDKKKDLKDIVEERSHKRLLTFISSPTMNFIQYLTQSKNKKQGEEVNLPRDIQLALRNLDQKIQKGDQVSSRIYYGLEYELLEAYEKTKSSRKFHAEKEPRRKATPLISRRKRQRVHKVDEITFTGLLINPVEAQMYRLKV